MKTYQDIYYTKDNDSARALDIYIPDGAVESIFMYIHGGGLDHGNKRDAADVVSNYLTDRGIAYVSIEYRMYPNAKYPDFINDAAEAVKYIITKKDEYFGGCDKLYVGGSSAGGYLSMMLCFDERYLGGVGLDNSYIAGYFHDAGQPTAHFRTLAERGIDSRRLIVDETSPMYHVGTADSYPPMRFVVSDNDMKGRYEQTMLMLSVLSSFGYESYDHIVMNGTHCAYVKRVDESGDSVLGQMIYSFIESVKNGTIGK